MGSLPIKQLLVERFRGHRGLELDGCGRINLLVGANNTGKTSVLDAISLFCRPLDIGNWREVAWHREVKSAQTPLTEPFKWLFPQVSGKEQEGVSSLSIQGFGAYSGRKLSANYTEVEVFGEPSYVAEKSQIVEESKVKWGLKLELKIEYMDAHEGGADSEIIVKESERFQIVDGREMVYTTRFSGPQLKIQYISPVTHRTSHETAYHLSAALKAEQGEEDVRGAVTEALRQIDPGVIKFEIVDTGKTASSIMIKHRETGMTPLSAFGDGMRRTLLMASLLPAARGGVLLIDEIETALHVSALDKVLRVLGTAASRYNVQIFATTHSLEAVDAVMEAFADKEDQLVVYRLRPQDGRTQAKRMDGHQVKDLRCEGGLDIR